MTPKKTKAWFYLKILFMLGMQILIFALLFQNLSPLHISLLLGLSLGLLFLYGENLSKKWDKVQNKSNPIPVQSIKAW